MSHMRSRSTLLNHLILAQNNFHSLGESNKIYSSNYDLFKMRLKSRLKSTTILPLRSAFIDQINHNEKTPNPELIYKGGKAIFLVRNPLETFESIRLLTKNYYQEWQHKRIEDYYLQRLNFLIKLKKKHPNCMAINSDDLINDSATSLKNLSQFLELSQPLTANYPTQYFTGVSGDPSNNIRQQQIIHTKNAEYSYEINKTCYYLFQELIHS